MSGNTSSGDDLRSLDERDPKVIEAIVSLARSWRAERDALAERLRAMESQLNALALKFNARRADDPPSTRPD